MDKLVAEMGEKLREAVTNYRAVRYLIENSPEWRDDAQGKAQRLGQCERRVRMAFYLQVADEHKGEMTSALIDAMVLEANEFMAKMREEAERVESAMEAQPA